MAITDLEYIFADEMTQFKPANEIWWNLEAFYLVEAKWCIYPSLNRVIGSDNALSPVSVKSLPEIMLTYGSSNHW